MSAVDDGASLARDAMEITIGACVLVPEALPTLEFIYKFQCDPGAIYAAGEAWMSVGHDLAAAVQAFQTGQQPLAGQAWIGSDRDAFDAKARRFSDELVAECALAFTVGIAMITAAITLYARIVVMLAMAVVLAAFATAIGIALATIVGAPVAAEIEADAAVYAETMLEVLEGLGEAYTVLEQGLGLGITTMLAADAGVALAVGDPGVLGEFGKATVDGLGTMASGLVSRVFRDATATAGFGGSGPLQIPSIVLAELNGIGGVDPVGWMAKELGAIH